MIRHSRIFPAAAAMAVLLGNCVGCGTGEYERRLEKSIQQGEQGSAFQDMREVTVPGTSVKLLLPPDSPGVELGTTPLAAETAQPRLKPKAGEDTLPALKATYEGFVAYGEGETGGKTAYYCYVSVGDMGIYGAKDPARDLRNRVGRALDVSTGRWEEIQCESKGGLASDWKRLQFSSPQEFYNEDAKGTKDFRPEDGIVEIYCREVNGQFVVICWRLPKRCESNVNLAAWATRVAGSVTAN